MPATQLFIRRAAVLGAGVMGAQIAAHLANAGLSVQLFDLASEGADKSAIAALHKLEPAPFVEPAIAERVTPLNYDDDVARLADCDLVIEAIAEKLEWKAALYERIAPHLRPGVILASNTSGLSIEQLSTFLPVDRRSHFLGIHFFNPPRYMPLVELIPCQTTALELVDNLETWLVSTLGKEVVRAKDTPNFIANRVGVFSFLAVFHHTARLGLSFAEVDALTGPLIGRPKSATYRTVDVVGLDTFANVIGTMGRLLAGDGWGAHYAAPDWMQRLIALGHSGQKAGAGVYRHVGADTLIYDPASGEHIAQHAEIAPEVDAVLRLADPALRLRQLRQCAHPQAQFLWAILRDVFHYSAVHLAEIAGSARDIDRALRCGYAWEAGPFELWQAAGWAEVATAISEDIAAGRTMGARPLPDWVQAISAVHCAAGSWSAAACSYQPRSALPVYGRQLFPAPLFGEAPAESGTTLWQDEHIRLWSHPLAPAIGICSLKDRKARFKPGTARSLSLALAQAEAQCEALVLWQPGNFCGGLDPAAWLALAESGDATALEAALAELQQVALRLQHAAIPTVAAIEGKAVGAGWALARRASRRIVALESQIGHDETGLGLIPLAGACAAAAQSAAAVAANHYGNDLFPILQPRFEALFKGRPGRNALAAQSQGLLEAQDSVLFNTQELLHAAIRQAAALADIGYRAPAAASPVRVAGRDAIATLEMGLVNLRDGGFISAHDYRIGQALATALCGGAVDAGSRGAEPWLLALERQQALRLLRDPLSQARLAHLAKTGKPLRN